MACGLLKAFCVVGTSIPYNNNGFRPRIVARIVIKARSQVQAKSYLVREIGATNTAAAHLYNFEPSAVLATTLIRRKTAPQLPL